MPSSSRYDRQTRLSQIGAEGQARLRESSAVLVGVGALGSTLADLLVRAGIGELRFIDRDVVEWTNLQRQSLFREDDARAGRPKVIAAEQALRATNQDVKLGPLAEDLHSANAAHLLAGVDLVLDGTDNFSTRFLLNDWSVRESIPLVYAGVVGTHGMAGAHLPNGPCLRCTWPVPPTGEDAPTCREAGVLGPAVAAVAAHAAAEALKILTGHAEACFPGYVCLDLWQGELRSLRSQVDPECPCCQQRQFPWLEAGLVPKAEPLCGGNAVHVPSDAPCDLAQMARRLADKLGAVQSETHHLRVRVEDLELIRFADGRTLVRGTEDSGRARSMVAKVFGS